MCSACPPDDRLRDGCAYAERGFPQKHSLNLQSRDVCGWDSNLCAVAFNLAIICPWSCIRRASAACVLSLAGKKQRFPGNSGPGNQIHVFMYL